MFLRKMNIPFSNAKIDNLRKKIVSIYFLFTIEYILYFILDGASTYICIIYFKIKYVLYFILDGASSESLCFVSSSGCR